MSVLNNRFLRYTGKISYGLYIFHPIFFPYYKGWALFRWSNGLQNRFLADVVTLAGEMALLYAVASLSWRLFEQPILKLKRRFEAQPWTSPQTPPQQEVAVVGA
jgi:peptidoglycan/LPS O-acetylase OafA/YrhL